MIRVLLRPVTVPALALVIAFAPGLVLVPTASGARYEGPNVELWNKGKDAMVTWEGAEMTCATR